MSEKFLEMYIEEMKAIKPCSDEESVNLAAELQTDKGAAKRLIEGNLYYVAKIANEYLGKGAEVSDLIQEGNMALTLLVNNYKNGNFVEMRERAVRTAMQQICSEQESQAELNERITDSVNVLNTVTTKLAQEYGRQATLKEIAEKMQMTEDEISMLMKEAVNAVSVNREEAAYDDAQKNELDSDEE